MLIWGGPSTNLGLESTGARYDPLVDAWTATSTTDAPSPRSGHTAVWTGSLMVVWGGDFDTGGRYNPLTDAWAPTSTVDAPSGRYFHTAVWTGSLMVVWGGFPTLDTGGRYDPADDRWMPTSTVSAPLGRYWHTAVWAGSRVVIWGGYRQPTFLGTGGQYDPVGDAWTPTSTDQAPAGRAEHTAVWTGERMIVWGGNNLSFSGTGTRFDTGGIYDPATERWTPTSTADAPSGRDGHTAVWTGTSMVVWGGQAGPPFTPFDVDTGGRFDPHADVWVSTSMTDAPSARKDHTAVWTGSDMLVWGGFTGPFGGPNDYPTSWGKYALGHGSDDDGDSFSECDGDCDDANATVYPGAPELCDNRDNDCDGALAPEEADGDGDGSPFCADCDDADPDSYPGAPELCDNEDNDCDTIIDEFITVCGLGECTSNGYCSAGVDSCTPGTPSGEVCDGLDNDCDGIVPPVELDDDDDGLADCEGDCDDANAYTYPGAIEVNDGDDNQCIGDPGYGLVDEIEGQTGFTHPSDRDAYCWSTQPFAVEYEASRSDAPDQPVNCSRGFTPGTCWSDSAVPPPGGTFFYLVRAVCQYAGSLGADSSDVERVWGCEHPDPGCPDD
jgi:N-acetylneuraminic acid mutarotase